MIRHRAILGIVLLLGTSLHAAPAACTTAFDTTTVASPLTGRPYPRIVISPTSGEPHLIYSDGTRAIHASRSSGSWSYEVVTTGLKPSTRPLAWAVAPSGRLATAYIKTNGRFVCAVSDGAGWAEDSSLTAASVAGYSLVLDPVSNEPCIACLIGLSSPSGTWAVRYAARQGGVWSVADADTLPFAPNLCLALDAVGQPSIAYVGVLAPDTDVVMVARRDTATAPFRREVVSRRECSFLSLAVVQWNGAPRVAFATVDTSFDLVYAERDMDSGTWASQRVDSSFVYSLRAVSLALTSGGDPVIAYTRMDNVLLADRLAAEPGGPTTPDSPCEGGTSGAVCIVRRSGETGLAPFGLDWVPVYDLGSNGGSLALSPGGAVRLAVRHPDQAAGSQYSVLFAEEPGPVGVPACAAGTLSLAAPAPNPGRGEGALQVGFVLPRSESVRLELLDLAGRRVARSAEFRGVPGVNRLNWSPGPLRAGVYWLRLRSASGLSASRRWVVLL